MDINEVINTYLALGKNSEYSILNQVADEFRRGEDLRTLVPLLTHDDPRVVYAGAWIASEVAYGQRGRTVFTELTPLLKHPDPAILFHVIAPIASLVKPDELLVIDNLFSLADEADPAVRLHALSYLCTVSDSIVESLKGTDKWPGARLMLTGTEKNEIRSALKSERLFDQRMAIAAVVRNYGDDKEFIEELLPLMDDETADHLPNLLKFYRR